MRPQCKYVHLSEGKKDDWKRIFAFFSIVLDFVEVKNGYVSICKEAILGNCLSNECKFIIFVLKNFNGKFFLLITIKLGIRTSILPLQIPFLEKLLHINPFSFSLFLQKTLNRTYIVLFFFFFSFVFLVLFIRTHTHVHIQYCIFPCGRYQSSIKRFSFSFFSICVYLSLSSVSWNEQE